jgi:hypothetical protein
MMITAIIFFGLGLVVGWNFLDQPVAVQVAINKLKSKLGLVNKDIPPAA